jgi:tetratricopeptide (TPR) repeat protein
LEVNGVMVDGVAVEKNHARVTFDKIVRQGVDPGLVEKVSGNVFKTRIFPLFAQQSRRIQISYAAVLSHNEQGYNFTIPLMANQKVKDFALRVEAMNTTVAPIINQGQFKDLVFKPWQNAYVTELKKDQIELGQAIHLLVPQLADNLILLAKNNQDQLHFVINPKLDAFVPPFRMAPINHLQLVWDASHSRANSDHQLAVKLLDEFFQQYQDVDVELYLLRNELQATGHFSVKKGQWHDLKNLLLQINYDGGTNLSSLNELSNKNSLNKNGVVFLFSDGLHTFDRQETIKTPTNLHIFSTDLNQNQPFNQLLANNNGGHAYQLDSNTSLNEVVSQIPLSLPQLASIEVLEGQVSGLPQLPKTVDFPQSFPITGKLLSAKARLKLSYRYYGKTQQSIEVEINNKLAFDSRLPELIWASQQLNELQIDSKSNRANIISLSQQYGLVSDHTSLIVLESLDQYVEHRIEPPKTLPEMREQYYAQIKSLQSNQKQQAQDKISEVIAMWENRKAWWQRDFPQTIKKPKPPKEIAAEDDGERYAPEPPMMSMASPSPEAPDEEQGEIVVTGSRIMSADMAESEEAKTANGNNQGPSVLISAWNPETPYLTALKQAEVAQREALYYQLKQDQLQSPSFYFDCASFFLQNNQSKLGLQVLSNIAELKVQDSRLLRTMAMKLKQHQFLDLSIETYRKVLADRPEEPQSYRDLALVLEIRADQNNGGDALQDYQQALTLFYQVINQRWDRFHGIEVTTLMELNRLLPKLRALKADTSVVDPRLIDLLDVDIRITLSWDSDMTDIDLWVIEPTGEKVTYSQTLSGVGGMFHQDFTGGYGPEEYLIKRAPKGAYTIKVHFYGNNSPELTGATTLYVDVFTNYSRPNESKQTLSLRLDKAEDDFLVGTIEF